MMRATAAAWLAVTLAACTTVPGPPILIAERPITEDWRAVASAEDFDRAQRLADAWQRGLDAARAQGQERTISSLGPLLDPAAVLPRAAPPPGPYRCRVVRLDSRPRRRALSVFPVHFCHVGVEGELLILAKTTGAERPGGFLYPDSDARLVFLGATAIGDEPVPPAYGQFRNRDLIGIAERIAPLHYRVALPWPRNGAILDLLELVPYPPSID